MEYAEGETLSAYFKRKWRLREAELQSILYPILDGLEVVHGAEFLHRDIKPANIIIRDEDNSPVLLDFGAARQEIGARSRSVTSIITPGYAPIEQYSSRGDQGPWTDIYALGGVCYHALTGLVPEDATDRVRNDPLIPVAERCAGQADAGFLAAIDWALKVDEADRPQSVAGWRTALSGETRDNMAVSPLVAKPREERTSVTVQSTGTPTVPPSQQQDGHKVHASAVHQDTDIRLRRPRRRKGRVFAALACVCALLMGGGYYYYEYIHLPEQRRGTHDADRTRQLAEAEVARQRLDKISVLLSAAEEDLASNRLTSPPDANAWQKYQQVLKIEPGHKLAIAGVDNIIGRYTTMFESALRRKDFQTADGFVSRIREVWSDAPVLTGLESRIIAARKAQASRKEQYAERARQQAAKEAEIRRLAQIESYSRKFESALDEKDFDVASWYMDSLRVVGANIQELSRFNDRLRRAREAETSRKDLAAERARRQAVEEAERLRLAQIELYSRKFESALRAEDLDAASGYVDSLGSVNVDAAVVSDLKGRLSVARNREIGRTFKDCGYCPKMIVVPSGSFSMGSPRSEAGRDDDEGPRHRVRIDYRFAVGISEVTFREWDVCAVSGRCMGYAPGDMGWGRGNRPVINVSWDDAQSYVAWLTDVTGESYRLLSESEWEYVARAGSVTAYSWGNTVGHSRANCHGCGSRWDKKKTAPVGSFSANAWGLHDIHGNVWEWVRDCWKDSYFRSPSDGSPSERGDCTKRVLRGGAWDTKPISLRSADRVWVTAESRSQVRGFRVARTLKP